MKIGLTGGSGFLGQTILRMYKEQHQFVAPVSQTGRIDLESGDGIVYIPSDYSVTSFAEVFDGCDAVIHSGAIIPKAVQNVNDASAYLPNIISGVNVFEACRRLQIKNVVNISSGAVYDHHLKDNACERDVIITSNNAYGTSKRCVEEYARFYSKMYHMSVKSLRLGKMLGLTDNNKAFWYFLNACAGKEPIPIYGGGESGYDYLYVKDAASAAIFFLTVDVPGGVVNISYGRCEKNKDFIPMICEVFQNDAGYNYSEKPEPGDHFYMSTAFARSLGWKPQYTIRDALIDMKKEWKAVQ